MEEEWEGFWKVYWWQYEQYYDKGRENEITEKCDLSLESKE